MQVRQNAQQHVKKIDIRLTMYIEEKKFDTKSLIHSVREKNITVVKLSSLFFELSHTPQQHFYPRLDAEESVWKRWGISTREYLEWSITIKYQFSFRFFPHLLLFLLRQPSSQYFCSNGWFLTQLTLLHLGESCGLAVEHSAQDRRVVGSITVQSKSSNLIQQPKIWCCQSTIGHFLPYLKRSKNVT